MSFWNLYTEQNKTPVYVATDYNKLRSANRRKTSQTLSDIQSNRLSNCSDESTKLEDCAEENQTFFRHFTLNVPECHQYMDVYESCIRQRKEV